LADISPSERIIFPLDLPTLDEALGFVRVLKGRVGLFKIGLELFVREGPRAVEAVREAAPGAGIFLDLKFHDIPATVGRAMRSAAELGVEMVTVHCGGGLGVLEAAAEVQKGTGIKVLAVTVLTSLSTEDLQAIGIDASYQKPSDLVIHRARLARLAGCAGIVCSGAEAGAVREEFGPSFLVVTPGIRSAGDARGDQKRVVTPAMAMEAGSDYIVVGRPIREAPDPASAAGRIARELAEGLGQREA